MADSAASTRPLVERMLDQQSDLWERGERLVVEELLRREPSLSRDDAAVLDLVYHELVLRQRAGEEPHLDEYVRRFPHLAGELKAQFQVYEAFAGDTLPVDHSGQGQQSFKLTLSSEPVLEWKQPDLPGYEVLCELGRGGMGVVYKARDLRLNRMVAVKMILAGSHASDLNRQRFQREAEAAGRLRHPNIVQIHATGDHESRPFIVFEYVDGPSLEATLAATPRPAREAATLAETLARAMHAAHGAGVVHRDLKPANVLLTSDGTPKIADFGLARQIESTQCQTESGAILGTPSYMAPEQARGKGKVAGPAADVYALGAILYELLTGRPPFKGETSLDTLQQVMQDEPVPPRRLHAKVPRDVEIICLKCLQKDPSRRYASAQALADDLGRFLSDQPIKARSSTSTEVVWRWCRRNPSLAAATGIAVAGLVGVSVVSIIFTISASRSADELRVSESNLRQTLRLSDRNYQRSVARLSENYLERGRSLIEQGSGVPGILLMAKALEEAPRGAQPLKHSIRTQLGSFGSRLHRPTTVLQPPGHICAVAADRVLGIVATGTVEGTIVVWDLRTGDPIGQPLRHEARIRGLALSPDGRMLMSGCDGGMVRIWDLATSQPVGEGLKHKDSVLGVAISPDGRRGLAGSLDGTAYLWDLATGRPIGKPITHARGLCSVRFEPQGKLALIGGGDHARLLDVASGTLLGNPLAHKDRVNNAIFSPDCRFVLTASRDKSAQLWDIARAKPAGSPFPHSYEVRSAAFSPDGRRLATASADGAARIWDAETCRPLGDPLEHQAGISSVAFSPDGSKLLTGSDDRSARLWDVSTGKLIGLPLAHRGEVWGVGFSPDGRHLFTWGMDDPFRLWHRAPEMPASATLPHDRWVSAVALRPDGRIALTGTADPLSQGGNIRLWDTTTKTAIAPAISLSAPVLALAFSPDGRHFVSGTGIPLSGPGEAQLWDAGTRQPLGDPVRHAGAVTAVEFSPDGSLFLSASLDHTVQLRETRSGKGAGTLPHPDGVIAATFSPDGTRILTGCKDNLARIWDVETRQVVAQPFPHQAMVMGVAFSPDGRTALTGGYDQTARLWDAATGKPIGKLVRHKSWVRAVAFSPVGKMFLTGSADNSLQLWDEGSGHPLGGPLKHRDWVTSAVFSRDGQSVLSGSKDRTARLWSVQTPVEGDVDRVVLWAQVVTGAQLDENDVVRILDVDTWQERTARLDELGGPPMAIVDEEPQQNEGDPESILWHQREADVAETERRWSGAVFHLNRILIAQPKETRLYARRGLAHAAQDDWNSAVADFARAIELAPDDVLFAFEHAGALLLGGDLDGYRRANTRMLERFGPTIDPWVAYSTARACLLAPQTPGNLPRLEQLAQMAVAAFPDKGWPRHTLALASYRAGRFDQAIERFHESMKSEPQWSARCANWLGLALAHKKLGHEREATLWFKKGMCWEDGATAGATPRTAAGSTSLDLHSLHPHDILACPLLRREALDLGIRPEP